MPVFINLPVEDLARSREFYAALGFSFDERFADDTAFCMQIDGDCYAMLLTRARFSSFTGRPVPDPRAAPGLLLALSRGSREEVNALFDRALAAGGSESRPAEDHGFMFTKPFADPDGHVWEPFWMDPAAMEGEASGG